MIKPQRNNTIRCSHCSHSQRSTFAGYKGHSALPGTFQPCSPAPFLESLGVWHDFIHARFLSDVERRTGCPPFERKKHFVPTVFSSEVLYAQLTFAEHRLSLALKLKSTRPILDRPKGFQWIQRPATEQATKGLRKANIYVDFKALGQHSLVVNFEDVGHQPEQKQKVDSVLVLFVCARNVSNSPSSSVSGGWKDPGEEDAKSRGASRSRSERSSVLAPSFVPLKKPREADRTHEGDPRTGRHRSDPNLFS